MPALARSSACLHCHPPPLNAAPCEPWYLLPPVTGLLRPALGSSIRAPAQRAPPKTLVCPHAGFETNYTSPYLHHVKVPNLAPNTRRALLLCHAAPR